jgi:hypothetical protein
MKLILTLTDEDGVVLDTAELTEDELRQAQGNGSLALLILGELKAGV